MGFVGLGIHAFRKWRRGSCNGNSYIVGVGARGKNLHSFERRVLSCSFLPGRSGLAFRSVPG